MWCAHALDDIGLFVALDVAVFARDGDARDRLGGRNSTFHRIRKRSPKRNSVVGKCAPVVHRSSVGKNAMLADHLAVII